MLRRDPLSAEAARTPPQSSRTTPRQPGLSTQRPPHAPWVLGTRQSPKPTRQPALAVETGKIWNVPPASSWASFAAPPAHLAFEIHGQQLKRPEFTRSPRSR